MMKHVLGLVGLIIACFSADALADGNVALGFPLILVGLCSIGAAYAQLEGIGFALIALGIGVGFYVGWWQAALLFVFGVIVVAHDPEPRTPLGIVLHAWGLGADSDSSGGDGGGGDGC